LTGGKTYDGQILQGAVQAQTAEFGQLHHRQDGSFRRSVSCEEIICVLEASVEIQQAEIPPSWASGVSDTLQTGYDDIHSPKASWFQAIEHLVAVSWSRESSATINARAWIRRRVFSNPAVTLVKLTSCLRREGREPTRSVWAMGGCVDC
jgi:hypothetical protein